jgi:23S rRNA pseudouridine955/2504/2580 synthase
VIRVPPLGAAPTEPPPPRPVAARDAGMMRALVLHQDDHVIVLNKPPGLAVQGGTGTHRHIDGMLEALQFDAAERPRLVHRLDRDTSGVFVVARTAAAARFLGDAFRDKTVRKVYWALVVGSAQAAPRKIDSPIASVHRQGRARRRDEEEGSAPSPGTRPWRARAARRAGSP